LADKITAAHEAQLALVEGALTGFDAELDLASARIATTESVEQLDEVFADSEASAADRQQAVIDAAQDAIRQGDAAVAAAEAQNGDIALSAEETARIQREALASVADDLAPGSPLRVMLEEYIARLDAIPPQIHTQIVAEIRLRNERFATLSPGFDPSLLIRGTQPRAAGGDFQPGWVLTGEEGPELMRIGQPGTVLNASDTASVLSDLSAGGSGPSFTQQFYGPTDPVEAGRQARKVQLVWS
jgi:multidrug efflux pump subunit AcrA (membrane-fusion protein)